jgi:hypothetical protein
MTESAKKGAFCLAAPLALAACATAAPPPPAITTFLADNCPTSPDLSLAVDMTPEKERRVWPVDGALAEDSPCIDWEGANGPYMVYQLPTDGIDSVIEVGTLLEGARLVSPNFVILDESGNQTRTFTPEQYQFRSSIYSVQFVPQEGESYVLVTTNPVRIGKSYDALVTGTVTNSYYTGYGVFVWTSGLDYATSRGFSYTGAIRANVYRNDDD